MIDLRICLVCHAVEKIGKLQPRCICHTPNFIDTGEMVEFAINDEVAVGQILKIFKYNMTIGLRTLGGDFHIVPFDDVLRRHDNKILNSIGG